jgi:hypothetical protein
MGNLSFLLSLDSLVKENNNRDFAVYNCLHRPLESIIRLEKPCVCIRNDIVVWAYVPRGGVSILPLGNDWKSAFTVLPLDWETKIPLELKPIYRPNVKSEGLVFTIRESRKS